MLAHDVRRLFSILRIGLIMLASAKDFDSMQAALNRIAPEVERSMRSVNGLI